MPRTRKKYINFERGEPDGGTSGTEESTHEIDEEAMHLRTLIADMEEGEAEYGRSVTQVLQRYALWTAPSGQAQVDKLVDQGKSQLQEDNQLLDETKLLTGKMRLEYQWNQLDEEWRRAYVEPIKKAYRVYIEHDAIEGVPEGKWIEPRRILPSRLVLTNKERRIWKVPS